MYLLTTQEAFKEKLEEDFTNASAKCEARELVSHLTQKNQQINKFLTEFTLLALLQGVETDYHTARESLLR